MSSGGTPLPIDQSWRRPVGVAAGTWRYVHQGSIADQYDAFVEDTPLCELDASLVRRTFPAVQQPAWVMDLGCGTGRTARVLAASGYRVLAIDLSQPMLRQVTAKKIVGVHPLRANLVQLQGIRENSVIGAVCMFSTLGMIQGRVNRIEVLRNARRIVQPGGTLVVHVHHRYAAFTEPGGWRHLIADWGKSLTRRTHEFGDRVYAYRGLPDMFLHRFSERELRQDFSRAGWKVQDLSRLSLDGAHVLPNRRWKSFHIAGGFFVCAQ